MREEPELHELQLPPVLPSVLRQEAGQEAEAGVAGAPIAFRMRIIEPVCFALTLQLTMTQLLLSDQPGIQTNLKLRASRCDAVNTQGRKRWLSLQSRSECWQ